LFVDTGFTDRQPDHFPENGLPSRSWQWEYLTSPPSFQNSRNFGAAAFAFADAASEGW